ncbi:MAG: hypothetical protein WCJ30_18750, partial [Deltaproteobacteria bacterium]
MTPHGSVLYAGAVHAVAGSRLDLAPWIVALALAACAPDALPGDGSSGDGAGADTPAGQDVTSPPTDGGADSRVTPD